MPAASSVSLVAALRQHHLLESAQLQELGRFQTRFADPHQLTQELLQRGWLTAHQATLLLAGRGHDLVLGPYTVLDRLGEGGNGEVFKARHRTMQRIVALKIVRKELLADPDVVGRFHREVEVLSQIAHPNIVHAYDAGPIGASLGLAMEYVAGVDLERLVERSGKLKANQAIDYIRQAARGLQHAQERGLIHRDIKPANLLVTQAQGPKSKMDGASSQSQSRQSTGVDKKSTGLGASEFGLLKILDLGLARLQQPVRGSQTGNLTVLGDSGITLGTPDYMAPEQALDFHSADTRADIYSLGCTFYYLLTGQPPFPGGSLAQKLMKHQQVEPRPVRELRDDLPAWLPGVLDKMLAKRPPDRFQTPGEVVKALGQGDSQRPETVGDRHTRSARRPEELTAGALPGAAAPPRRRRRLAIYCAGGVLLAGLAVVLGLLLTRPVPSGETKLAGTLGAAVKPGSERGRPGASSELVTNITASSKRKYDLGVAQVEASIRTDRVFKITALSPGLEGAVLMRTANDDKYQSAPNCLTFTLTAPALVHVAYDKRGTTLPGWLNDGSWQLTAELFAVTDGDPNTSPMKVFAKQFPPGPVSLGGNRQEPAKGAGSNYVVIIKPL